MQINIVLVEPEIPQNTGNIARTCAATGARLHLVGPMGFKVDDRKLKRAGLDYWHLLDITYYDSLTEFLEKTPQENNFFFFTTKGKHIHSDLEYPENVYLFFGKETKGLPEWLPRKPVASGRNGRGDGVGQRDLARSVHGVTVSGGVPFSLSMPPLNGEI